MNEFGYSDALIVAEIDARLLFFKAQTLGPGEAPTGVSPANIPPKPAATPRRSQTPHVPVAVATAVLSAELQASLAKRFTRATDHMHLWIKLDKLTEQEAEDLNEESAKTVSALKHKGSPALIKSRESSKAGTEVEMKELLKAEAAQLELARRWVEHHRRLVTLYINHAVALGVKNLTLHDVPSLEEHFAVMTKFHKRSLAEKRQWMQNQFVVQPGAAPNIYLREHFESPVSVELFCSYYGIKRVGFVYDNQKRALSGRSGAATIFHPRGTPKTDEAAAWIQRFVDRIGDHMPEVSAEQHKTLEIPVKNRARLFMLYRGGEFGVVTQHVCRTQFYHVLGRVEFAHIRFPSLKKAFYHRCLECVHFDRDLQKARTKVDIARAKSQYTKHLLLMMRERELFARTKLRAAACTREEKEDVYDMSTCMSLIIDGMDQVCAEL